MPDGCIWYSYGSDKTGPALADALGFQASKKTPSFNDYKVVVGWGCKPSKKYSEEILSNAIREGKVRILNHPEMVNRNRNKLETLKRLKDVEVAVPSFMEFESQKPTVCSATLIPDRLEKGLLAFPLMFLNEFNKGEPAICYTIEDVSVVLKGNTRKENPYNYVRTYDHGNEYRIHVFRDIVLFAQKKNLAEDPVEATIQSLMKKFERKSKSKDSVLSFKIHRASVEYTVSQLATEIIQNTSQLKKSVSTGWKLENWDLTNTPPSVMDIAIEALEALYLDMGAVSVSYADKIPRVLSVTTAPALDAEQMAQYVVEIESFTNTGKKAKLGRKPELVSRKERKASPELVARLYRKLKSLSAEKAEEVLGSLGE